MTKTTIEVEAEITITGTFVAIRKDEEGEDEEMILREESEEESNCAHVDRNGVSVEKFPHALGAGDKGNYGYFIGDIDLADSLSKWGGTDATSTKEKGVCFVFRAEVDVKETVGIFAPILDQKITVT